MNAAHVGARRDPANAALLRERGVEFVGPEAGELAEGETGMGRMAEPADIAARAASSSKRCRTGRSRASGSSSPPAAPVSRSTPSASSATAPPGRWAWPWPPEAARRGAEVTLVAANVAVPAPRGVEVVETPTAADLEREVLARADADVVLMAAAVADYRPAEPIEDKRPKNAQPWTVALEPTDGCARGAGRGRARRPDPGRLRRRPRGARPRACAREARRQAGNPFRVQRRIS